MDCIRHLLSSQSLNDHYAFLSYLSILPVQLWAGPPELDGGGEAQQIGLTHLPLALGQWEVERIITFMDSSDEQIRRLVSVSLYVTERTLILCDADIIRLDGRLKYYRRNVLRRSLITSFVVS